MDADITTRILSFTKSQMKTQIQEQTTLSFMMLWFIESHCNGVTIFPARQQRGKHDQLCKITKYDHT